MLLSSRDKFRLIFELSKKQPWISEKADALDNLLWGECDTDSKRELILELIDRFVHISSECYKDLVGELASRITAEELISDETTQLVAMAADSGADSSQYLLYDLKFVMEGVGWRKYKQVNTFGSSYKAYKKNNQLTNIILIDEFMGTGSTVINRVKEIIRVYEEAGINGVSIYVKVIAATEQGINAAIAEGINIESLIVLKKGISNYYEEDVAVQKIQLMLELEGILSSEYGTKEMPSLGYGQTESLYTRDNGNTPNSVFPIFWWPFKKDGQEREVILLRAMGDA